MPIQNTWRFRFLSGFSSKTAAPSNNHDPSASLESLERWSFWATIVIILGIVLEALDTVHFAKSDDTLGDIVLKLVADVLVGIGLLIEAVCIVRAIVETRREKRESDEKVAEANKAAGEARQHAAFSLATAATANAQAAAANKRAEELRRDNLELQASLRPRRFSFRGWVTGDPRQTETIYEGLKPHAETIALIQSVPDFEAQQFARDLAGTLAAHGWKPRIVMHDESHFPDLALPEGLWLFPLTKSVEPASTALWNALIQALHTMGITQHGDMPVQQTLDNRMPGIPNPRLDPPVDAIFVRVGLKSSSGLVDLHRRELVREGEEQDATLTNFVRTGGKLKHPATDGTMVDVAIGPDGKLASADPNKKLALPDREPTFVMGSLMLRSTPFPDQKPEPPVPKNPLEPSI